MNSTRSLALLVIVVVAALGCDRSDGIQTYSAPKDPPAVKPVEFALPQGWREVNAQEMQYAAFSIDPNRPDATLSITALPSEANALAPNVNRWEGQLGLQPSPPDAVQRAAKHVDVGDAHIDLIDLSGTNVRAGKNEPWRILGAVAPYGTLTWFFKLEGPPDVVAAQQPNFDAFVRSLKFKRDASAPAEEHGHHDTQLAAAQGAKQGAAADPHAGHDHGPGEHHEGDGHDHGPPQPAAEKINWGTLPAGWVEDPAPRPMRAHTINVEADGKKGEMIVTRLPQAGVGQLLDNVNRWRGHVGLAPTTDPKAHVPRQFTVAGLDGFAFDFEGQPKDGEPAKKQTVALTSQGQMFWFVRFLGPKELVDAQQKTFEKVLTDARFAVPAGASQPNPPPPSTRSLPAPSPSSTQPSGSPR